MAAPRHSHRPKLHKEVPPASSTSPFTILNALKLILIISLSFCVVFNIFYLYPNLPSAIRWLWSADFKAKLTPPVLFLLLNLLVGALALTSGLVKRNKPHIKEVGDLQDGGEIRGKEGGGNQKVVHLSKVNSMLSKVGRGMPPKSSSKLQQQSVHSSHVGEGKLPMRKLSRSKSDKLVMVGKDNAGSSQQQHQQSSDEFAKKKKKKMMDASPQNDALSKASSAPTSTHGSHHHHDDDAGDEVDRKAEDFIGKFYQQMKMQRLESMKRYKERMDRSYGS